MSLRAFTDGFSLIVITADARYACGRQTREFEAGSTGRNNAGTGRGNQRVTTSVKLWIAAVFLTVFAAGWQRRTGPSYPFRTAIAVGGTELPVRLSRSNPTSSGARIAVPTPAGVAGGTLYWRRYPTSDPFTALPLQSEGTELVATLPIQPPAGKVEYYLELQAGAEPVRVPAKADETVILRYHGQVPPVVLIPHIVVMFLAMLIGVRAGLAAVFDAPEHRRLALIALAGLTLGGLILGPITQKYAFGAFWTGVPWGWDLTDNKTLLMWLGWAVAGVAVVRQSRATRWLVVFATVLMVAVYLVPHSLRGSQLDYTSKPVPTQTR